MQPLLSQPILQRRTQLFLASSCHRAKQAAAPFPSSPIPMLCYNLRHTSDYFSIFSMSKGGARPGAGRPKGSTNVPQFRDYVTEVDIKEFVEFVLSTYKESERLTTWVGDHFFLKLPQTLVDDNGEAIAVASFIFQRNENNKAGNPADS
jgi:hypothetical protein